MNNYARLRVRGTYNFTTFGMTVLTDKHALVTWKLKFKIVMTMEKSTCNKHKNFVGFNQIS